MFKKKIFVSFDFDNDESLKTFLLNQTRSLDCPFELPQFSFQTARSMKHWEEKTDRAIRQSDVLLVLVGLKTFSSKTVAKEIQMAKAASIPIVQIVGYREGDFHPVPNAGHLYRWQWDNLKRLIMNADSL